MFGHIEGLKTVTDDRREGNGCGGGQTKELRRHHLLLIELL